MPFAGGLLDQPAVWRRKFQRFLPYVIDQHIVRQLNARYSKTWKSTPWPKVEEEEIPAADTEIQAAQSRLSAFLRRAEAAMQRSRKHIR